MAYDGYSQLKVLVIDDFDNFRMTICRMLQELGVEDVETAVNGAQAVKFSRRRSFDMILCDYNLGSGKNGQQVLEELRVNKCLKHRCLFVLISAETSRSMIMATYDYEPDAYLTKPITSNILRQRLDRLLRQRQELLPIYDALDEKALDKAINLCRTCIDSDSRYTSQCQKLLGNLYLQTGALAEAETLYRKVLEVRALDWAQVGLAKVKQAQGEFQVADKWLREIIVNNPLCMQAYDALAENCKKLGDDDQLQTVLHRAVEISPMSLVRQLHLAQIAVDNNDLITAANAWRRAVRLGQFSCRDKLENHLNFARTAAALFNEDVQLAQDLSRDALRVLSEIPQRFEMTSEVEAQALLVESQVLAWQGQKSKAEEILREVESTVGEEQAGLSIDTQLDQVVALKALKKDIPAKKRLDDIIERYREDEKALVKIDRLLEEPLSEHNRQRVAKLNRGGIGLYEQGRYKDAIDAFKQAKRLFPNHLGVHLNLVQALLGEMEEFGRDEGYMDLCLATLKKVGCRVTNGHAQYKRYLQLQDKVKNLGLKQEGARDVD